ncbi:hypothetical protein KUTeg_012004 [Tegillarca granosa]|uniref:RAP domain-containing protein n=1 Tax=Tegillarca granosa TaxID=220873 RepID=A0ABQ9EYH8_TEGGR|nr:hypothetical protein KUTeg_012004 [Tegillarca granosa]
MKILELVTKKFRPLGPFLYLKCRPVAQSTKIVSRHICQAKHLDILNDQCKPVTYFLSRSYCSHTSGNLQKISDMLDALNLEQIESKECRNIIFNLLEVCVNAEDRTFEGKDSFFVIYFIFHKRQSLNFLDFQKHQKHTLELTKFQKFLETLPDHLETMSVEDMVDIFGGLAMLGIPKTNFVITQLLLKILNPEVQLGLSEIAKLLLIFQDNFHFSHIIKFTFLYPTLKSCLTNLSSYDRDDLKYLSYLMEKSMIDTYPELLNIYMKIISEVFKDKQFKKDADCLSDALKGLSVFFFQGKGDQKKAHSPQLVEAYINLMEMFVPVIDQLSFKHLSQVVGKMRVDGSLNVLDQKRPELCRILDEKLRTNFEELMVSDMPVREKMKYMARLTRADFKLPNKSGINRTFLSMIPNADEHLLLSIVYLWKHEHLFENSSLKPLFLSAKTRLLELLHEKQHVINPDKPPSNFHINPFYPYINTIEALQRAVMRRRFHFMADFQLKNPMDFFVEFKPYLAMCLQSGQACNNDVFSRVCEVAIPIFGNEISQDTMKRIEDIIFSKKGVKNAQRILRGSLYIPSGNNISLTIELNIKTAINEEIYSGSEIVDLISAGMEGKGLLKSKIQLTRFFARKLETLKGIEKSLLPVVTYNMDAILSEKMANRVLKYYVKHFNSLTLGQKPGSILLTLLRAFFTLSRLPEHTEELREISKHMLDTYLGNGLSASNSYQMLHYLCHFGIYFDEHLQEVFSSAWFDKLFDVISNLPSYAKTSTFYFTLHHVLGGDEYFKTGVPIEYELLIDFEYFVDSNKMPVNYEEAKKMDLTKSDIKKCAVYCGRPRNRELMAKDKDAVSVDSAQKILHLRTLGYQVAFIHKPDWMSLITDSDRYIYMRSTLGISKPPDTTSDTKDLKDGGHHDTAQSPYLEVVTALDIEYGNTTLLLLCSL